MIEKKTDELRQVLHERRKPLVNGVTGAVVWQVESHCYSIQQKWLVENGQPYNPPFNGRPDSEHDSFIGIIDGRAMWQPMREEWRDLPIVTEDQIRAEQGLPAPTSPTP